MEDLTKYLENKRKAIIESYNKKDLNLPKRKNRVYSTCIRDIENFNGDSDELISLFEQIKKENPSYTIIFSNLKDVCIFDLETNYECHTRLSQLKKRKLILTRQHKVRQTSEILSAISRVEENIKRQEETLRKYQESLKTLKDKLI